MWLTPAMQDLLLEAFWQTLVMVGASAALAVLFGLPLALLLVACGWLVVAVLRRPGPPPEPPDPLRRPTPLYPHVNATDTFRPDPGWPAAARPSFPPARSRSL